METELENLYYSTSKPEGFSGATPFLKATSDKYNKNLVKEWLQAQDTYTLHKPARKRFPRNRYVVFAINELWQCDLNDLRGISKYNDGYNYILTVIDVLSKKLYARALKQKTATYVVKAFKSIFKEAGCTPMNLQSDKGTEFTGKLVRNFFKANGVKYFTTKNPDVKAAIVERVNKTLKTRMWRYLTYKNTYRYSDVLQKLVTAYNCSKHRSIKMCPNDVNLDNTFQVWMNLYGKESIKNKKIPQFKVGDCVRISKHKGIFEKGYETNWSEELFYINTVFQFPQPLYTLHDLNNEPIDGMFYDYELQKVTLKPERTFKVDKILGSKGRGVSKKYLIKWYGYSDEFNSWVPASQLSTLT